MKYHEVDYEIFSDEIQIIEVELDPAETVIAEAGAMNYMEDGFSFETEMGDDSKPVSGILDSLMRVGRRVLTSELIFMSHFSNSGSGKKRVAFAPLYPSNIIPIDMSKRCISLCGARNRSSHHLSTKTRCWFFCW